MGFADAYLLKAGLREALIEPDPHPDLHIAVIIPVINESGLERCLDSLFRCDPSPHTEVLVLINAAAEAPGPVLEQNQRCYKETSLWIQNHPHSHMDFHVLLDHSFGKKEAGVGMARKVLMDEAVRRFNSLQRPLGILASTDADAVVDPNYLQALASHFHGLIPDDPGLVPDGCSIYFEHPLSNVHGSGTFDPEVHDPEVYEAIAQYELHLRYYLQSLRYTGYPYAYHTVGSSFAVRADIYCMEGGMNRRKGGEDFYFIQKVAQRGNFSECNSTCVYPSPRPSDRVPFGTGLAVKRLSQSGETLKTYDPRPFVMLRQLFSHMELLYAGSDPTGRLESLPPVLADFLDKQDFELALNEIRRNSASYPAFQKRFWRWFNMFRIMKFLHYARERAYPDVPVGEAANALIAHFEANSVEFPDQSSDSKRLLEIYRNLERLSEH